MSYLEKNKITYFSFILSVLVIMVHSINMPKIYNIKSFQDIFGVEYIGSIVAPAFFVLSGFLFFVNINKNDSINIIKSKIIKRVHTVFIPFLMWNSIYYVVKVIYDFLFTKKFNFDFNNLVNAAINYTESPHLWFLYQLIILIVITPIIYFVLKNRVFRILFFILISAIQIMNIKLFKLNTDALIYFYSGVVLSTVYKENESELISKKMFFVSIIISLGLFFVYRLIAALSFKSSIPFNLSLFIIIIMRVFLSLSLFFFLDFIIDYRNKPDFINYSFFTYCFHYIVSKLMLLLIYLFVFKKNMDEGTIPNIYISNAYFVFTVIITIIICINLAKLLKNKLNSYYNVLTGGR